MGDYSSLVELLVEGCAEFAAEEALCVAYDAYELARNTRDVGKFIGNLTSELQAYGSATQAAASMEKAHMAYVMFVQCDTDDDGKISKTEFIRFASLMGETEGHAVKLFGALDTDNNGYLLFEEWIAIAGPNQGNPSSLNCPGVHGLIPFTTPADGYRCNTCGGEARRGAQMLSCRLQCQHDICWRCTQQRPGSIRRPEWMFFK